MSEGVELGYCALAGAHGPWVRPYHHVGRGSAQLLRSFSLVAGHLEE
jgi:hypothetical protein